MDEIEPKSLSHTDFCLLLDFYGQLLAARTREIMDLHFAEDMSLSEIAEELGITRQAVHDRIRQGEHSLTAFEAKLGLVERFKTQRNCIDEAIRALEQGFADEAKSKLLQLNGLL